MNFKKIISTLAVMAAVATGTAYCTVFDYFDAIADDSASNLKMSVEQSIKHESNIDGKPRSSGDNVRGYTSTSAFNFAWSHKSALVDYKIGGKIGYDYVLNHSDHSHLFYGIDGSALYKHNYWDLMLSAGSSYDRTNISVTRREVTRSLKNNAEILWNYKANSKFGVAISGNFHNVNYSGKKNKDLDYNTYALTFAPYYNVSEKTKVGLSVTETWKRYEHNYTSDDSNKTTVTGFVDYRVTGKIKIKAFAGFERKDYDENNKRFVETGRDPHRGKHSASQEKWEGTYGLTAEYQALSNLKLTTGVKRTLDENTDAKSRSNESDTVLMAGANWKITKKLSLRSNLKYTISDEKNSSLDNKEFVASTYLNYSFSNLRLDVFGGYIYETVNYDHNSKKYMQYSNNTFILGARYNF